MTNSRLRRLYRAAHTELASMASDTLDPASDYDTYLTAYLAAAPHSPAWNAYTQAMTNAGDRRTRRTRRALRVRWCVASALNRLPWQCWPTLVGWALDGKAGHGSRPRVTGSTQDCRWEARTHRDRACYCGKFRQPANTPTTADQGTSDRNVVDQNGETE